MPKPETHMDAILTLRPFNAVEAEKADYVVCINARSIGNHPGYVRCECEYCGRKAMHLPTAPVRPLKICFSCALETLEAGEAN